MCIALKSRFSLIDPQVSLVLSSRPFQAWLLFTRLIPSGTLASPPRPSTHSEPHRDARALLAGGDWHTADSVLADSAATQNLADRRASALLRAQCAASWSTALPAAAKSNHPEHILDKIRRAQEANGQAANGAGTRSDSILAVGAGSGANPLLKDQDQTQSEEFEPEEKPKAGAVPGWLIDSQVEQERWSGLLTALYYRIPQSYSTGISLCCVPSHTWRS